jgi:hypothetical protein
MADEPKKDETLVGTLAKNGGGAAIGATVGYTAGGVAAIALAPFTGGLSALIPIGMAVVGGLWGHNKAQDVK